MGRARGRAPTRDALTILARRAAAAMAHARSATTILARRAAAAHLFAASTIPTAAIVYDGAAEFDDERKRIDANAGTKHGCYAPRATGRRGCDLCSTYVHETKGSYPTLSRH